MKVEKKSELIGRGGVLSSPCGTSRQLKKKPPSPLPESKFWEGPIYATLNPVLKPVYRSLSIIQTSISLFYKNQFSTLQIGHHFFLNLNSVDSLLYCNPARAASMSHVDDFNWSSFFFLVIFSQVSTPHCLISYVFFRRFFTTACFDVNKPLRVQAAGLVPLLF